MRKALWGVAAIAVSTSLASCGAAGMGSYPTGGGASPIVTPKGINPGTAAPDFALPDQSNVSRKLADSKGKIVVLAFYPADMSSGCSVEAHSLQTSLKDLQKLGVQLYGISVQDVASKKKFCETDGIKYPLLSDTAKKVAESYGVLGSNGLAERVTYIVGADGRVVSVDRNIAVQTHGKDLVKRITLNKEKWSAIPAAGAPAASAPAGAASAAQAPAAPPAATAPAATTPVYSDDDEDW